MLPAGVYTLTFAGTNLTSVTATVSVTAGVTVTKNVAMTPVVPVVGTITGSAIPGGTVTVAATLYGPPGTITWTQKSGAPVILSAPGGSAAVQGNSVQVQLPAVGAFKDEFFTILANKRNANDDPQSALLNRTLVMGISPFDLDETGTVTLTATVQSGSSTYSQDVPIAVTLCTVPAPGCSPFVWSTGLQNAPIGLPVLLHTKTGTGTTPTYSWAIAYSGSGTSHATISDATTQNPYFIPDVAGKYTLTESVSGASIVVSSSNWIGEIDTPSGQPTSLCKSCHSGPASACPSTIPTCDKFTPWSQSGHAQIFSKNLNSGGHYSPSCFPCHTVGYDLTENPTNNGFDDQNDYQKMLNVFFGGGSKSPTANPNNWTDMLGQGDSSRAAPNTAKLANIQCENCHGPIDIGTHFADSATINARVSLSADVCGRCHGEPPRHGRFQQWQMSGHANYDLAISEGTSSSCARCHTSNGFLVWMEQTAGLASMDQQILNPQTGKNATAADLASFFGMTADTVHPQTCAACHDPHAQGNGGANATVRIDGDTKVLPSGYEADGVGKGALCITCHNTRNGLHNSNGYTPDKNSSPYRAPHTPSQGDVLMGENAYFVSVGQRSKHSFLADTCVTCHVVLSPPPPQFSLPGNGTNHTFKASLSICTDCHGDFDGGTLQDSVVAELGNLATAMESYLMAKINAAGATITVIDSTTDTSDKTAVQTTNIASVGPPAEVHGQQGFTVTFKTPVTFNYSAATPPYQKAQTTITVRLADFLGSDGTTALIPTTDTLIKAGWNYDLINGDKSKGVHNPSFVFEVLNSSQLCLAQPTLPGC
ncbi:MAG: hypothetical protein ACHQ9S_08670 [Candidatus Binatia bacterium]